MSKEPAFKDFDKWDATISWEDEKYEEFCKEIEPQIEMIKNFANQIGLKSENTKETMD